MNNQHPIGDLMDSTLKNFRGLIDANTVIGESITTPDGTMIIPVSKVSFAFGGGGADIPTQKTDGLFGGGSGSGATMQPIAFLIVKQGTVELLQLDNSRDTGDRMVALIPELVDKLSAMFKIPEKKEDKPIQPEKI